MLFEIATSVFLVGGEGSGGEGGAIIQASFRLGNPSSPPPPPLLQEGEEHFHTCGYFADRVTK